MAVGKGFHALYDSDELDCGHPAEMGDLIGYDDDDELLCSTCFREAKQEAIEDVVDEFGAANFLNRLGLE